MRNGLITKSDQPTRSMGLFDPLIRMRSEMDRMLEGFLGSSDKDEEGLLGGNFFSTKMNTSEDSNNYYLELELPGVKKDEVSISLREGHLMIEGTRQKRRVTGDEEEPRKFHRVESSFGQFRRSMKLPRDAQEDGIRAKFEDGILNITVPRNGDAEREQKQIKIED